MDNIIYGLKGSGKNFWLFIIEIMGFNIPMSSLPKPFEQFMQELSPSLHEDFIQIHQLLQTLLPNCHLQFESGKMDNGKAVHNPTLGYGILHLPLANGQKRETFQVGLSTNKNGLSLHIMGLRNKKPLSEIIGPDIGKASITGYCLRLRSLSQINLNVLRLGLQSAIQIQST